jgi:hypothetical protein
LWARRASTESLHVVEEEAFSCLILFQRSVQTSQLEALSVHPVEECLDLTLVVSPAEPLGGLTASKGAFSCVGRQALARRLQPDVLQTLETLAVLDGTTVEALVSEMELDVDQVRSDATSGGYPMPPCLRRSFAPSL